MIFNLVVMIAIPVSIALGLAVLLAPVMLAELGIKWVEQFLTDIGLKKAKPKSSYLFPGLDKALADYAAEEVK